MAKKADINKIERKIREALEILELLGFPRQQQNERSALTILSLLNLKPNDLWENASAPLMGITPMMDFFAEYYGKKYAPNTRETVRRRRSINFYRRLWLCRILINPPGRQTAQKRFIKSNRLL